MSEHVFLRTPLDGCFCKSAKWDFDAKTWRFKFITKNRRKTRNYLKLVSYQKHSSFWVTFPFKWSMKKLMKFLKFVLKNNGKWVDESCANYASLTLTLKVNWSYVQDIFQALYVRSIYILYPARSVRIVQKRTFSINPW